MYYSESFTGFIRVTICPPALPHFPKYTSGSHRAIWGNMITTAKPKSIISTKWSPVAKESAEGFCGLLQAFNYMTE
jgi:hypothetical protein